MLTVDSRALAQAIALLLPHVTRGGKVYATHGIKVSNRKDTVSLTATNSQTYAEVVIASAGTTADFIITNPEALTKLYQYTPTVMLDYQVGNDRFIVRGDNIRSFMAAAPADSFPERKNFDAVNIMVESTILASLDAAGMAAERLGGMTFKVSDGQIMMTAGDGVQAARVLSGVDTAETFTAVLPRKSWSAVADFAKLAGPYSDIVVGRHAVRINFGPGENALFKLARLDVLTMETPVREPKMRTDEPVWKYTFKSQDLDDAVASVSIFAKDNIGIETNLGSLNLFGEGDNGWSKTYLPMTGVCIEDSDKTTLVNCGLLMTAVRTLPAEDVAMSVFGNRIMLESGGLTYVIATK